MGLPVENGGEKILSKELTADAIRINVDERGFLPEAIQNF